MEFLSSLFKEKKVILQDDIFGLLTVLRITGDYVIWQGEIKFLNTTVALFVSGTKTQLNNKGRQLLIDFLSNEFNLEPIIEGALKSMCSKPFSSSWQDCFNCLSIFAKDDETEIIFQEKKTLREITFCFSGNQLTEILYDN